MHHEHGYLNPFQNGSRLEQEAARRAQEAASVMSRDVVNAQLLEAQRRGADERMQQELAMQLQAEAAYVRQMNDSQARTAVQGQGTTERTLLGAEEQAKRETEKAKREQEEKASRLAKSKADRERAEQNAAKARAAKLVQQRAIKMRVGVHTGIRTVFFGLFALYLLSVSFVAFLIVTPVLAVIHYLWHIIEIGLKEG